MTQEEYEARRRALEQQLQADVALIQAAHAARVRSLDTLWQAAGDGVGAAARPAAPTQAPAPPPKRERVRPHGAVLEDLADALPQLPETFDRRDIDRLLGYRAERPTLYRALTHLKMEGLIDVEHHSLGGQRTRYRKLNPPEE